MSLHYSTYVRNYSGCIEATTYVEFLSRVLLHTCAWESSHYVHLSLSL